MKGWNIKEVWINSLILLTNQIRVVFFWLLDWCLLPDCVSYIRHGIYTVIVGWHRSCSPSLSAAVQLPSIVILSCLTHKPTNTHYSHDVMEVFAKVTLWSRRCFSPLQSWSWFFYPVISSCVRQLQASWEWHWHLLILI